MTAQQTMDYKPEPKDEKETVTVAAQVKESQVNDQEESDEATGTAVSIIEITAKEIEPALFKENGLDPFIDKVRKLAKSELFDVTTEEGRRRIGSVARQIGSAKSEVKKIAQGLTEDWRKKTKAVTSETTRMEKEMDAIRNEVLAPRKQYNEIEKNRVDGHKKALADMESEMLFDFAKTPSSADVLERLDKIKSLYNDRQWQEFSKIADQVFEKTNENLKALLAEREKSEKEQAELEELRKKQSEREQKERDEAIAKEAADRARKEAEEKAAKEKAEADRKAKEEQDRLRAEKEQAEAAAKKAEDDRLHGHYHALEKMAEIAKIPDGQISSQLVQSRIDTLRAIHHREWQEFDKKANKAFSDLEKSLIDTHALIVKAEEEAKAKADKEAADRAAQAERDRAAAEKKKELEAEASRAADQANKSKVHNAVLKGLTDLNNPALTPELAKAIVTAIAQGKLPHVSIKY